LLNIDPCVSDDRQPQPGLPPNLLGEELRWEEEQSVGSGGEVLETGQPMRPLILGDPQHDRLRHPPDGGCWGREAVEEEAPDCGHGAEEEVDRGEA